MARVGLSHNLSALVTLGGFGGMPLPTSGVCTLNTGWKQKSLPGPPVSLSLPKTESRKERVQDTISFLRMSPVSSWGCHILSEWPKTFPGAVDLD